MANCHVENWGDSGMADNSQQTDDTSTDIDVDVDIDIDTDDKHQVSMLSISQYLLLCFNRLWIQIIHKFNCFHQFILLFCFIHAVLCDGQICFTFNQVEYRYW